MNHIIEVIPKKDFSLHVTLENGSILKIDMKNRLNTVRFCMLEDKDLFNQVEFKPHYIYWNHIIEISIDELFEMAQ